MAEREGGGAGTRKGPGTGTMRGFRCGRGGSREREAREAGRVLVGRGAKLPGAGPDSRARFKGTLAAWRLSSVIACDRSKRKGKQSIFRKQTCPDRRGTPVEKRPAGSVRNLTSEMWEDYLAYRAAGLLREWRRKWKAYLPI